MGKERMLSNMSRDIKPLRKSNANLHRKSAARILKIQRVAFKETLAGLLFHILCWELARLCQGKGTALGLGYRQRIPRYLLHRITIRQRELYS